MEPPPSSQISEPPPNIFQHSDGSPLQIFAEAGHIQARPQLVRRLKRFGATICSDPKNAQIILVNPESTQGRIFVRNWGHDANKVVLDSAWAKKCFDSQKALLEEDEYGGYVVLDDGRPIETEANEESGEENTKSPLPTPRATPVEPIQLRAKTQDRTPSVPPPQQSAIVPAPLPPPGPSMTPDLPATPTFNGMGMDMATMAQFMQQFAAAPSAMSQTAQLPLMMQQQAAMQMFPSGFPFGTPQQNMHNDPFWLAVRDTMMNKGLYPSQTQPPPSQLSQNVYSQPLAASPVQQQVLPFPPIPSADESIDQYAELSSNRPLVNPKPKHRAASPLAKRRKTSSSSFQEASTSSQSTKTNGSSMGPPANRKLFTKRSGKEIAFFVQVGGHNRFGLVQSIKKNGGAIVSNINDADFVILFQTAGIKSDKTHDSFLHQAISADLPAVPARFVTDCLESHAILDPTPYLFSPVKRKRKRGIPARSASPMSPESEDGDDDNNDEVVERGPPQYQEQDQKNREPSGEDQPLKIYIPAAGMNSILSRNPSTHTNGHATSDSSLVQKRGRPRKSDSLTIRTADIRATKDPRSASHNSPPSPTPPGSHTVVLWGNGFKFSREEDMFAIAYAKVLIERDHTVSMNSIGTAIYKKLPHHTLRSWRTHLMTLFGDDLDEWRKRAGIAFRKAQNARRASAIPVASSSTPSASASYQLLMSDAEEPPPSARVSTVSVSPPISEPSKAPNQLGSPLEDDLVVISKFFAEGNDDQTQTEEAIWAKLTVQTTCKTEATWEEFYQKHSEEVQTRYQCLVDAQASL